MSGEEARRRVDEWADDKVEKEVEEVEKEVEEKVKEVEDEETLP